MGAALTLVETSHRLNPVSTDIEYDDIVPALTKEIRQAHFVERVPISRMAKAMRVSPNTVSKLLHGETKYPRFATISMALHYFGYRLIARR